MTKDLSAQAWNARYLESNTPWDLNGPTPELQRLIAEGSFKNCKNILIPGGGSGYDAVELSKSGLTPYLIDFAAAPLTRALENAAASKTNIFAYKKNFFDLFTDSFHTGFYDAIWEYTFYCAIDPELRGEYAKLASKALRPNGIFIGLFFPTEMDREGPPFVVSKKDVTESFSPYFELNFVEPQKSITPRKSREFLGIFKKRV